MSAPDRIRTCNLRSRNPLRYPLRHGGNAQEVYPDASSQWPSQQRYCPAPFVTAD